MIYPLTLCLLFIGGFYSIRLGLACGLCCSFYWLYRMLPSHRVARLSKITNETADNLKCIKETNPSGPGEWLALAALQVRLLTLLREESEMRVHMLRLSDETTWAAYCTGILHVSAGLYKCEKEAKQIQATVHEMRHVGYSQGIQCQQLRERSTG
ncbi:hypothetical protein FB45DRAFT_169911 [Roridomyces roridus]|uniref:Uncharacterized protein n=1 Tax=Roridomyces roridus TaxID=1738132 RepID=A0AAD7BEU3_9AGAR|nr:hypothetical protein FB45DRAFT_169911 [Roridomyces roridus]